MIVKSRHNPYFDFLRGIAILMVVGIHTYPEGQELWAGPIEFLQLLLINIFNCAVPLFLAISGFFIAGKNLKNSSDILSFWKRQIPTVYIPCLIFSIPWFILHVLKVGISGGVIISSLLNYFLCGYSIYYFIALIIECYLLAPLLVKYNNYKTLILIIVISVCATVILEYLRFILGYNIPLIIRGSFLKLLLFFYLGIYLSKTNREYSLTWPLVMIAIGIILGLIQMEWILREYGISAHGQKLGLYIFDIGFILICMSKKVEKMYKSNCVTKLILKTGEISFGIYFTHIYVIFIADHYYPSLRLHWIILWGISIIVTVGIILAVKKIAPNWSHRFLGYR